MKVRPRKRKINGHTYKDYVVYLGKVNGRPVTRAFTKRKDADAFCEAEGLKRQMHGDAVLTIPHETVLRYTDAERRLAAVNATIEQAAEYYLQHHKPVKAVITLGEALRLRSLEMELADEDGRYYDTFVSACKSFITGRESTLLSQVDVDEVGTWVRGNGWSPKTQRNYFGSLRALFGWAVDQRYLSENPLAGREHGIRLAKKVDAEITAFGPEHCERLLWTALTATKRCWDRETKAWAYEHTYRRLIGYAALALFCGVRPEEVKRSPRTAVDVANLSVVVMGKHAKTARRRVVDLHENAAAWLALWLGLCPDEQMIIPKNFTRLWKELRALAQVTPWPHDVLRHTYASMHFAANRNKSTLQADLGHSEDEDTLERHYKAIRTIAGVTISKPVAVRFWNLYPPPRYPEISE